MYVVLKNRRANTHVCTPDEEEITDSQFSTWRPLITSTAAPNSRNFHHPDFCGQCILFFFIVSLTIFL